MTLKKICLFAPISTQYGVIDHFTQQLSKALKKQGVENVILEANREDPESFLKQISAAAPDCTLSFNGLLPDPEGRFLCDLINIPHVACLTDAPNHYFSMIKSPLNILTCVDKYFCKVFTDLQFPQVIFLPHAANPESQSTSQNERKYDVLVLNSFIDYEAIRKHWTKVYSPELCQVLDEAATIALTDYQKPYMQAFIETLDKHLRAGKPIDPRKIDYETLLDELEAYVGGRSRTELLKSIENAEVHVFGSNPEGWRKYLGSKKNIHIHDPVPFEEALKLMREAKIILNCTPEIKEGAHERILNGLACGAAVLTLDTPYIKEQFKDGEDILLYSAQDWKTVNQKIVTYLKDEKKRSELAAKGRTKVLQQHTWDQRAATLIKELTPMLQKLKSR